MYANGFFQDYLLFKATQLVIGDRHRHQAQGTVMLRQLHFYAGDAIFGNLQSRA